MQPYTDFSTAFQEGYTFQYDMPYEGPQDVTISVHPLGELVLTSGKVTACDPLMDVEPHRYFVQTVEPGRYPVIVSVATFSPRQDKRLACTMLRISESSPVRWEHAVWHGAPPLKDNQMCYYGVDTGTGCFMDVDAAQAIQAISAKTIGWEEFDATMSNELLKNCIYVDYPNTSWAILQIEEFVNNLVHEYYPDVGYGDDPGKMLLSPPETLLRQLF